MNMRITFHAVTLTLVAIFLMTTEPVAANPETEATRAFREGRWQDAHALLVPLATDGNPRAQTQLGLLYYHGDGVPQDVLQAFNLFYAAATQGNREAQYHLGNLYLYHHDVPLVDNEDPDRTGAMWIIDSATRGYPEAQYTLGLLLLAGTGVRLDPSEGIVWIRKAASGGHPLAAAFFGEYIAERKLKPEQ